MVGPDTKVKSKKRVKDFATSSFKVSDQEKLTRALTKLCHPRDINWCPKKYHDQLEGKAFGMPDFIVCWWRRKKTVSFAGKGSASAKR